MSSFSYKALQSGGGVTEGVLEASGRQDAFKALDRMGLKPIRVAKTESGDEPGSSIEARSTASIWTRKKVSHRQLENFTRQLASLLAAGVPLAKALHLVSRETSSPVAGSVWQGVYDLVVDGSSLAGAMSQFPETFPRVYVAMVQAGEAGGFLELVLEQIADFQSRQKELRSKVMGALIYPVVLAGLAVAVVAFLLVFFIPRFKQMFADFGAALPGITRFILYVSDLATRYGILLLAAAAVAVQLLRRWLKTESGRLHWENMLLRLPLIGSLVSRFAMTRFCRMLGTLTRSGVPLVNALRVARESIGNQILVEAVSISIERVQQGDSLGGSLAGCPDLFPNSVLEMVTVAEEAGHLDEELIRLAAVTERDLDRQMKTAVALAEPAMLFVMASVIGVIVVGMVLPIFAIQEYIK